MSTPLGCARLALALLVAGVCGTARAAEAPPAAATAPDVSAWPCRFCEFETGIVATVEPRVIWLSDDSYRFGDYTGLEQHGVTFDLGAAWHWRNPDTAAAWDFVAERAALESRAVSLRGGRQGSYRLAFAYEGLPHLIAADSNTVFTNPDGTLTLPAGWTCAGSTGGMTALDASLQPRPLHWERERLALGFELTPHRAADLRFDYRRDEIDGTRATGGSFMTLASELPRQIDQAVDRADVSATFRHALGHAQLALASSFFSNDLDALRWQNPYNGPTAGADVGQLAQAPDNQAHRVSLNLGSPPGAPLHASAQLAVGRLSQDQRFLPATVNPEESVALPRDSLDGRVDTTFASVRATYRFATGTRVLADVLHDRRDNRTPVAAYTQVVMDTFTGDVRSNAPFGSTRDRWRLSVEDRSVRGLRLGLGVEDDTRERRLYDVAETQEARYWGRLGWRPVGGSDLRVRVSHAERDGRELAGAPAAAAQNPLLRAYHTAARDRDEVRADLSLGLAAVATTFNVIYGRDDYPDTRVGRTGGTDFGYGMDAAAQIRDGLALSGFVSRRLQDTEQAGSQGFGVPDWLADQEDATSVVGAHLGWQAPRGFEVGADYVYSRAAGAIVMAAGGGETAFPTLVTRWQDARVFTRYAVRPALSLRLDLIHERYRAYDWALDGVGPDTVPNLLALGQGTQSASVTAVVLGLRFEFREPLPVR